MRVAVVVPTIREVLPERVGKQNADFIIVNDTGELMDPPFDRCTVYGDKEQDALLGDKAYLIPRRTAGCRNFGLYVAYTMGYDVIIHIDDDEILPPRFVEQHLESLTRLPRKMVWGVGGWINTYGETGWFARGFPYQFRPIYKHNVNECRIKQGRVVSNMGVWTNVPDLNGIDKLGPQGIREELPTTTVINETYLAGGYVPWCSMNVSVVKDAAIGISMIPMGHKMDPNYDLYRLEDVWGGYILQVLARLKSEYVTIGTPIIEHVKVGNLWWEVWGEHYAHMMSEHFYLLVNKAAANLVLPKERSYNELYVELALNMLKSLESVPEGFKETFRAISNWMVEWGRLFLEVKKQ